MSSNMPVAEFDVDSALVQRLLVDQHPDLAHLQLAPLACGWDNAIFRLGDALTVRMPRRQVGADLIASEQRWLPELAPHLPLPTPCPVRIGRPALGYPWSWSVCPWLPGEPAALTPPRNALSTARTLGAFLKALHIPAASDAPVNPFRGIPLLHRNARVHARIEQLHQSIDAAGVRALWEALVATPIWQGPPLWLHGDLHAANILVDHGSISAVIDFGDITGGDPATDIAVAWIMLPKQARGTLRNALTYADDLTWARARGWALVFALEYLANSADNPMIYQLGLRTLPAVMEEQD